MDVDTEIELLKVNILLGAAAISAVSYSVPHDPFMFASGIGFLIVSAVFIYKCMIRDIDPEKELETRSHFHFLTVLFQFLGVMYIALAFGMVQTSTYEGGINLGKGLTYSIGYFAVIGTAIGHYFGFFSYSEYQENFSNSVYEATALTIGFGIFAVVVVGV